MNTTMYDPNEFFSAERKKGFTENYLRVKALADEIGLHTLRTIVNMMCENGEKEIKTNVNVTRRPRDGSFVLREDGSCDYSKHTVETVSGTFQAFPNIDNAECGEDSCPIPGLE